ncbi:hypothetical protein EE612_008276, partial [Oryza sativa]
AEWTVGLEVEQDAGDGADGGGERDEKAGEAERLQADPGGCPPPDAAVGDVHLDGEVDGERPEAERPQDAHHVVEEGQQHRHHRRHRHEARPPRQPEHAHLYPPQVVVAAGEAVGPPPLRPPLHEGEERLAVHLVRPHQVYHDRHVGHVQQPVGLVEAEAGEEVPRRVVAERRVPHASAQQVEHARHHHADPRRLPHRPRLRRRRPQRVLDLDEDDGVGVGEGDVPQRLQVAPHLLRGGDDVAGLGDEAHGDAHGAAGERAVLGDLGGAEGEADGGVGEGHDGGEDGEPPDLVEVGDLGEEHLDDAEHDHVHVAGGVAWILLSSRVEAVGTLDRHHANGGGDGVTDGHSQKVEVLNASANLHLGTAEVGLDGVHVGVVPSAGGGVAGAVAVGEEVGGEVDDGSKEEHDGGAHHPAQLRDRPRQRQHT